MILMPYVSYLETASGLEAILGIKFKGPGLYVLEPDLFYVIAPKEETLYPWRQSWPNNTVFTCVGYDCELEETLLAHIGQIPLRENSRD